MKNLLIAGVTLAAMIAGPAVAADMPVKYKAPPPVVVYDWSGAYIGFSIGGVWTDVNRHYEPSLGLFGVPIDYKSSGDDVIYDFHAGAQWQWGQWVLGVEADYAAGFREMQSTVLLPAGAIFPANFSAYNKITNLFTVGPRLGFAWDRWMIYGTGGWASANIKGQYFNPVLGIQVSQTLSGQSRNDGWFAGAGIEYMVHKGALVDVIFGAEYQHFDVRSKAAFCQNASCTLPAFPLDFSQDARGDIVRARLTIKTQGWGLL
jgi:outer membrane immunogenic protein